MSAELDEMIRICDEFDEKFLNMFSGVKLRCDANLTGNDHYVCVSPEVMEKIKDKSTVVKGL